MVMKIMWKMRKRMRRTTGRMSEMISRTKGTKVTAALFFFTHQNPSRKDDKQKQTRQDFFFFEVPFFIFFTHPSVTKHS